MDLHDDRVRGLPIVAAQRIIYLLGRSAVTRI